MAATKVIPAEMKLLLASATGKHYEVDAREVYVETDDGDLGVLPGHQPEFYSIGAGYVKCKAADGEEITKLVFNGFVQIEPDVVRIGVQEIYEPGEVDTAAVEAEIGKLKDELAALTEEEEEAKERIEREIRIRETLIRKAR